MSHSNNNGVPLSSSSIPITIASRRNVQHDDERESSSHHHHQSAVKSSSRRSHYAEASSEPSTTATMNEPKSSKQQHHHHRSNSAPKRSSSAVVMTTYQERQHEVVASSTRASSPSSSSEELQHSLTYEEAIKQLGDLSPKSKSILKAIMKTMNNNTNPTTNGGISNPSSTTEITQQSRRTNSNTKNDVGIHEKMSLKEPSSSTTASNTITNNNNNTDNKGEEKPPLRRTVSSTAAEVGTKSNRRTSSNSNNKVVTLNVGGHLFQTTSKTLRRCESLFSAVFSEKDSITRDENGHVFIDRDPKYFRHILNYLRDGKVMLLGKSNDILASESPLLENIIHEALYFKLPGIINDIEKCRVANARFDPRTLEDCQLRFYNQEVVKKSETGSVFACLDFHLNKKLIQFCNDPYRYYVKFLLRYGESSNLAIGVTCKQSNRWNRFEVLKKIKEKDTIALWYNYQTEHLVLYWNDTEVQRKTFKINNSHKDDDWVFHVEMFSDDNFCGLKIVQQEHHHLNNNNNEQQQKKQQQQQHNGADDDDSNEN